MVSIPWVSSNVGRTPILVTAGQCRLATSAMQAYTPDRGYALSSWTRRFAVGNPSRCPRLDPATTSPSIILSNRSFEFQPTGLAENMETGRVALEEQHNSDGVQTTFRLKEKPLVDSIHIESPPGTILATSSFTINYDKGSIRLHQSPPKGENVLVIKYLSHQGSMLVKSLKVKATYAIQVCAPTREEVDEIAEQVVKALLGGEDGLAAAGFELKPVGGETWRPSAEDRNERIQLIYEVARELQVRRLVPPIEKIKTGSTSSFICPKCQPLT